MSFQEVGFQVHICIFLVWEVGFGVLENDFAIAELHMNDFFVALGIHFFPDPNPPLSADCGSTNRPQSLRRQILNCAFLQSRLRTRVIFYILQSKIRPLLWFEVVY